jgi:uncharacterized protein YbbK (DUF523 family)/uncharacterized protein YbgA (DUF1722 family)
MPANVDRPRIGVSSCLLGERVRYDGGHKRDSFVTDLLGRYVEWIPVCPEMEIGLGVPRDSLHLSDPGDGIHLIATKTGKDLTARMSRFSDRKLKDLADLRLSGYVLKSKSPSCGMERVRVFRRTGVLHKAGRGVFAEALINALPDLPVEEEGRLQDPRLRENFVTRVYAYHRWQQMAAPGITRARLMSFHESHKFLLMSTRKNHTNVLQHLAGFLKERLDSRDRQELADLIDRYRRELLPLIVPVTLLRHYVVKYSIRYLENQTYLNPHPHELMLLNHV